MYLTRDLEEAGRYAERSTGEPDARYGLLASSGTQTFCPSTAWTPLPATKRVKLARWYNEPAGIRSRAVALQEVVTEFGCQGSS